MGYSILILDDMLQEAGNFKAFLEKQGFTVNLTDQVNEFYRLLDELPPEVIFLDINLGPQRPSGIEVMEQLQKRILVPSVIVMSARAARSEVAAMMRYPVAGYIEKAGGYLDPDQLVLMVKNAAEMTILRRETMERSMKETQCRPIIYQSEAMKKIMDMAYKYAQCDHPVLITGESGTGKEMLAKTIHFQSSRRNKPFHVFQANMANKNLIESELFGYHKGAFTGAINKKSGHIAASDGGTLFLDELGLIPPDEQAKLLRVLETKQFYPVGSTLLHKSDFRLISATNECLPEKIKNKEFRLDLFQRISTLHLHLPPLRERLEDAVVLFEYFLTHSPDRHYHHTFDFSQTHLAKILGQYNWSGNIRELENFCVKLLQHHDHIDDNTIDAELKKHMYKLPEPGKFTVGQPENLLDIPSYREATDAFEKLYIEKFLRDNNNDVRQTAGAIGLDLSTLYKKLRKYRIPY